MDVLEPFAVFPIPTEGCLLYKGIAFDGCCFYLTMPKSCRIYQFNTDYEQIKIINVNKPYSCICYDNSLDCFWAATDNITGVIFKLDHNLKEIDFIRINPGCRSNAPIKSLSYNCEKNILAAAYSRSLAEITKDGKIRYFQTSANGYFSSVLSAAPYYITSMLAGNTQCISIFDSDGCCLASYELPVMYQVEALLFYPWEKGDNNSLIIYILATKHCCYPRLLKCKLENCNLKPAFCNYEWGRRPKTKEQSANDLIESIALEEAALSNILNELGSKIQKTTQMADNIDDLLEVNKAVNKTITNITQLEHILYAKLETINSLCDKDSRRDSRRSGRE